MRPLRVWPALGAGVLVAADDLLAALEDLRLQGVAPASRRVLGCHAEVHRGQEPALVDEGELLDGLACDADAARHLLWLASTGRRDLALLDVVYCRDLLRYPAGGPGLHVLHGAADSLAAAGLDGLHVCDELPQVFDLDGYAAARHGCHLLQGKRKKAAGLLVVARRLSRCRCSVVGRVSFGRLPGVVRVSGGLSTWYSVAQGATAVQWILLPFTAFYFPLLPGPLSPSGSRPSAAGRGRGPCMSCSGSCLSSRGSPADH